MNRPRWNKVFHDLWDHKARTILAMLTISVGVLAVGFVSNLFFIALKDMDAGYQATNPHAAIIYTDPFGEDLLHSLARVEGVGQVEGRNELTMRILTPAGEKRFINFQTIPPLDEMRIDLIEPSEPGGDLRLDEREVFIEQSARDVLQVRAGDLLQVESFEGDTRQLWVAGYVHSLTVFPYQFTQQVSAFVSPETMVWLGGIWDSNRVYLTVAERKTEENHVRQVAKAVAEKVEDSGRNVDFVFVYMPGRHFATDVTVAMGAMMAFLGGLAIAMSAFLIFSTVNAMLGQQVRQIGIMKAIGAGRGQLLAMYVVLVMAFGLLALAITVPLSGVLSHIVGGGLAVYLNFKPGAFRIPRETLILQSLVALVIPIGAALLPVIGGVRITVREAISNYGLGQATFGQGLLDRLLERIQGLPRPLMISLRNTFRRKARLALTLSTLILAGAIFIAVFNLRASMNVAIDETFGYLLSDVNLFFTRPHRLQKLLPLVQRVPGVVEAEAWGMVSASVLSADLATSTQVNVYAPPAKSTLIKASLTSGRWLLPEDTNAVVIGNHLKALRPELDVGDQVILEIEDERRTWTIVGIYRMAGNVVPPIIYANDEHLSRVTSEIGQASNLRIRTARHDGASQRRIAEALEAALAPAGVDVARVDIGADLVRLNTSQTDILVYFLLVMAVLIALVGGLGLMSAMSMNVMERTREIGVMRAIGASDGAILQLVVVEGMLIGLLSWMAGAMLALPISSALADIVGRSMLQSPLEFAFSLDGFIFWLVGVLALSALASAIPARNAYRLTVREVLAYE